MAIRVRFAPSPTGLLHLGNARTFLLAWLSARSQHGTVVFRLEDIDSPRVKPWAAEPRFVAALERIRDRLAAQRETLREQGL